MRRAWFLTTDLPAGDVEVGGHHRVGGRTVELAGRSGQVRAGGSA